MLLSAFLCQNQAPIPEGVDIHAQPEQTPVAIEEPVFGVTGRERAAKKNASIILVTIIILMILAVLAWIYSLNNSLVLLNQGMLNAMPF